MERAWVKKEELADNLNAADLNAYYYDFGAYYGFLYNSDWKCWHVLDRSILEDGSIQEVLEEMPEDWIPQGVLSIEKGSIRLWSHREIQFNSWSLVTQALQKERQASFLEKRVHPKVQQQPPPQQVQQRPPPQQRPPQQVQQQRRPPPQVQQQQRPPPQVQQQQRPPQQQQQRPPQQQERRQQQQRGHQPLQGEGPQRQSSSSPREELHSPLLQQRHSSFHTENRASIVTEHASSASKAHEQHQSQHQSRQVQQTSLSSLTSDNGPQWTSLTSLAQNQAMPSRRQPSFLPRKPKEFLQSPPVSQNPSVQKEYSHVQPMRHLHVPKKQPLSHHNQKDQNVLGKGGSSSEVFY